MGALSLCVQAVLPLLVFMLFGYILRLTGLFSEQGFLELRRLAVTVLIPFTNFQSIHKANFFAIFPGKAIALGLGLVIVLYLAVSFLTPYLVENQEAPTFVHGVMHPNMSIIGIPLARQLLGEEHLPEFVILLSFLCLGFSTLMVLNHQRYAERRQSHLQIVIRVLKTPLLLGALLGIFFSVLPLRFPELAENIFSTFSGACGPICLLALGGSFTFGSVKVKPVLMACVGKLLIVPAATLLAALICGLPGEQTILLMLAFVCPTALLCQMLSETVSGDPQLGSQIVVYTSILSTPVIFGWVYFTLRLTSL